jgi:hypothetical protein
LGNLAGDNATAVWLASAASEFLPDCQIMRRAFSKRMGCLGNFSVRDIANSSAIMSSLFSNT